MGEPQYRLEGIVHTKSDVLEDFEGPLDVIFELLSKNKIEIQDVSISCLLYTSPSPRDVEESRMPSSA